MGDVNKKLDQVLSNMNALKQEIQSLKKDSKANYDDLHKSVEFCTSKLDEILSNASTNSMNISDLKFRFEKMQQHSRINNLELSGVPEYPNEDLVQLMSKLGETIGEQIVVEDLDKIHRVNSFDKSRHRPIICRFISNIKKSKVLSAFGAYSKTAMQEGENVTADIVGIKTQDLIFLNHHLTPEKKTAVKRSACSQTSYFEEMWGL